MMNDAMRPSMDTDDGTVETTETMGSSQHRPLSIVEEVSAFVDEDLTVGKDITPKMPSTMPIEPDQPPSSASVLASDATSTRSMPMLHISRPQTPADGTASTASPSTTVPPSPARSRHSVADELAPGRDGRRQVTRRTTLDARANNRLSGFFNNLVHRRSSQMVPTTPGSSSRPGRGAPSPTPRKAQRTPSPTPPVVARPATPPPLLPAPTLSDLGLTLSTVTAKLSPSHFSSPPTSGAFLAPNYLLLCHAQGLDVLPLTYPPVPQPYALIRRVSFKSVVVMEHRGVLVAIAGRRDGVRVYALEEIKKAVEWRIDVEVRREREKARREEGRKGSGARQERLQTNLELAGVLTPVDGLPVKPPATGLPPRRPDLPHKKSKTPPMSRQVSQGGQSDNFPDLPPAYSGSPRPRRESQSSTVTVAQPKRSRATSVSEALAAPVMDIPPVPPLPHARMEGEMKGDWVEQSISQDDEAIDIVAAGASGSQALDEWTSASARAPASISSATSVEAPAPSPSTRPRGATIRRQSRPTELNLTDALPSADTEVPRPQPSPVPTLITLRQTLSSSSQPAPPSNGRVPTLRSLSGIASQQYLVPETPDDDDDDDGNETPAPAREQVSFAQMLMESRIPDLPPPGSRQPQQPILLTSSHPVAGPDDYPSSPRASESNSIVSRRSVPESSRRRRRWSVLGGIFPPLPPAPGSQDGHTANTLAHASRPPARQSTAPEQPQSVSLTRRDTVTPASVLRRPSTARAGSGSSRGTGGGSRAVSEQVRARASASVEVLGQETTPTASVLSSQPSRLSRFFNSALHPRRSEDSTRAMSPRSDPLSPMPGTPAPAPKLEYVKLPGTKSALMIKSVETAKKSFLAILCGDAGEKVELFAGTYRTALGLSRTFILPDSPRSLELQLQGDDLVEVFLVFSQNVFGLEPATVRVREVRIGRSERRAAARRRARAQRGTDDATPEGTTEGGPVDDDTNVTVTVGVASDQAPVANEDGAGAPLEVDAQASAHNVLPAAAAPNGDEAPTPQEQEASATGPGEDPIAAAAAAQMGPFTTFQQLTFAPNFPLAAIAQEYIIPPMYSSFLEYRKEYEPEAAELSSTDLATLQFTPPGLPLPSPLPPSRWFYKDPKGNVHGPWKAALMESWYKEGLLHPDLPIRREEEGEFTPLKELRAQSVDPTHPFRPVPPPLNAASPPEEIKPLLSPISLLSQPRHFGPPALFFSSRGGHSTTIVDARGRSVIKGRFMWTPDEDRLGDVRHLEAFDVQERAVLVALRRGGLEALDLGDALLQPGDASRSVIPHYAPPVAEVARRRAFTWKIGTPAAFQHASAAAVASIHKAGQHRGPSRKASLPSAKSPGRTEFLLAGDEYERSTHDEVFFLGRKGDEVYFCERTGGAFRILRICPDS